MCHMGNVLTASGKGLSETGMVSLLDTAEYVNGGDNLADYSYAPGNATDAADYEDADTPLSYKIVATVLHVAILIGGLFGNVVLILVARRTRSLQTPTYCYLVSLAYADLIVLLSAIPEAILFTHLQRYVLGQAGCSLLIFGNFLGINAGSLSILAFTVERYIAVLRPLLAQKVCRVSRANKIITVVWIVSIVYCTPWLFLTKIYQDARFPEMVVEFCDFRVTEEQYASFFLTDLVLFYFVPLIIAATVYSMIAWKVKKSNDPCPSTASQTELIRYNASEITLDGLASCKAQVRASRGASATDHKGIKTQALPMLMVVVVLFAVSWLPFRGLLVYNSLAPKPWLNTWYLLFAKTLIYINSAINPFLYNFMSRRFREAVFGFLGLGPASRPVRTQSCYGTSAYNSSYRK